MKSTWVVSIYLYINAAIKPNLIFITYFILSMKKIFLVLFICGGEDHERKN